MPFDETSSGYAVIDLETTGRRAVRCRIIEIGVVLLDANKLVTAEWEALLNPGRSVGPIWVHGIDSSMVSAAPNFGDVLPQLVTVLEGRVLVAHNAPFDQSFLDHEMRRCGIQLMGGAICTRALARRAGLPSDLGGCARALGIESPDPHRALADARVAAAVFTELAEPDDQRGVRPLECWRVRRAPTPQ